MRPVSILYLPSEDDPRFGTKAIVKNLAENPPAGDFIIFSDHPQPMAEAAGFKITRLKDTVEQPSLKNASIVRNGRIVQNKAAVNHMCFLTALRIAESQGYSHFHYLEEDNRVKNGPDGKRWDEVVFEEFFNWPRPLICGGFIMVYNPSNQDRAALERYERFLEETKAYGRKLPVPVYGDKGAQDSSGCCPFPNGAGGVYSVAGLNILFPERQEMTDVKLAASIFAWDFAIGVRGWKLFKQDFWEMVGLLPSVCSHYGDVQSTLEERLRWLEEGKFRVIHQVKVGGK